MAGNIPTETHHGQHDNELKQEHNSGDRGGGGWLAGPEISQQHRWVIIRKRAILRHSTKTAL